MCRTPTGVLIGVAVLLGLSPGTTGVGAQGGDPALSLQRRAIARIDALVDGYRRTGNARLNPAELAQADTELAASNRAFAARPDWSALAQGLTKQGAVRRMQGNWSGAVALYQQAYDAASRGRDPVRQGDALAWRALAKSNSRDFGGALTDAAEAVRLLETTTDKDLLANALDILGNVQLKQRDLNAAGSTFNREMEVTAQSTDPMAAYFAHSSRSDVYLALGQQCQYDRSFDTCYQSFDKARADLDEAGAIVRRLGFAGLVRQTDQFIQDVETQRGIVRSQQSMSTQLAASSTFKPRRPSDVLVTQTFVAPADTVPAPLMALYRASKQFEQQAGAAYAGIAEARSLYLDGLMSAMGGDTEAALRSYLKAIDSLEHDRRSLHDEQSRGTFAEDRINFYYDAVLQLLERRRYPDAFEVFEKSRSRALVDLLATRQPGLSRPQEQKLYAEAAVLRTRVADLQGRLFELESGPSAGQPSVQLATALQNQIRNAEAQYQDAVSRMSAEAPRLATLVNATPVSLSALQQAMRADGFEVLQYMVTDTALIVWHISGDTITVRNVFLPRSELAGKLAALRESVASRNSRFDETTAKELFLFLVQPVLAQIRSDRVVIIPHEDLNTVPFQVLLNPADGRYVGERFQISYAPSATVLLDLKRSSNLTGARVLAVADPGIPAAGPEVNGVGRLFPGRTRIVSDTLMREADLKSSVHDYDVVHLSVHGKFDSAEPMLSYVALAPGGGDDGKLTAAEMFGLPLDNNRLVVLSACETGRAAATHGNEVLGIERSLIYAGAGTLVLSYWEVDSDATALWMQTFYQAASTRPMAEAARIAAQRVKANPAYSHPYYWAAFGMVGR
jgi:CHAT domain-containing protein/tetratricopeptide (TPR) repeat protein